MKFIVKKNKKPIIKNSLQSFQFLNWDSLWAYHPCVTELDGKYYMVYTGKSLQPGISHNIGIAVSSDLQNWKKLQSPILKLGNPGDWDDDFVAHAYIYKENSKFYMLYDGSRKGKWLEEIGLAESDDLKNWKKYSNNPILKVGKSWWERIHVSRCCIIKEKNLYFFYYAGHDGQRERIGLATGENITSLKRYSKEPILDVGNPGDWDESNISDPRVIKYKQNYYMFYTGANSRGIERIGVATSKDLCLWKKYSKNPVLNVSPNSWDSSSAARGDIVLIDGSFYIFYSGRKKYTYSIGKAEIVIL